MPGETGDDAGLQGAWRRFTPVLGPVLADAVMDDLFDHLAPDSHELVALPFPPDDPLCG